MAIFFYKVDELYGCFSNFSPHGFQSQGQTWMTVEHYYQAQKFVGTCDRHLCQLIQQVATPIEAATLGRRSGYQIRPDWEQTKTQVMYAAVLTKFQTHLDIQTVLLATGDQLIIEDSPVDAYWGCGPDGLGQNQLGKTLMNVRQSLRQAIAGQHLLSNG
jgi:N-glycosidase YbiA